MALDSGTCARLKGCVRILWSLTYDSRSAWSYSLSAGLLSYFSFSNFKNGSTFRGVDMLSEYVKGIDDRLYVIPQNYSVSLLFGSVVPKFLCHLSIKLSRTTSWGGYFIHGLVDLILLEGWSFRVAKVFERGDNFIELRHRQSKRFLKSKLLSIIIQSWIYR